MAVYIVGCLLSVLFTGTALRVKHESEGWKYWVLTSFFSSLPLMVIASIRYNVGQDYPSYIRLFRQAVNGYRQPGLEIPFHELNRLVYRLGGDYTWIFTICAILFCTFTFLHILQTSPSPKLSAYLLVTTTYYFVFLNATRQMVGCAILLYSLKYVKEKKLLKFIICVLLAGCFHYTCLLFIVVYFFNSLSLSRTAIVLSTIIVFVLSSPIASLINRIASFTYYGNYIGGHFDTSERGYVTLLISAALIVFSTIYYRSDEEFKLYYNLNIISLWLSAFVGKVVLIGRIRWMFGFSSIILIPMTLDNIRDKKTRFLAGTAIVVLYAVYFYYTIGINNSANVLPYQTIFSR